MKFSYRLRYVPKFIKTVLTRLGEIVCNFSNRSLDMHVMCLTSLYEDIVLGKML